MASNPNLPPTPQKPPLQPGTDTPSVPSELTILRTQLEQALQEINNLRKAQNPVQPEKQPALEEMEPPQALEILMQDPVAFVQELIEQSAKKHLWNLKEEAELAGALKAARNAYPEFEQFEPFIIQEVATLIQNDPDGVIDPWHKLFEKGVGNFKKKFRETLKESAALATAQKPETDSEGWMEGKSNRLKSEPPPSFSREQIARMSLDEFLKNEAAINEALKNNRIK